MFGPGVAPRIHPEAVHWHFACLPDPRRSWHPRQAANPTSEQVVRTNTGLDQSHRRSKSSGISRRLRGLASNLWQSRLCSCLRCAGGMIPGGSHPARAPGPKYHVRKNTGTTAIIHLSAPARAVLRHMSMYNSGPLLHLQIGEVGMSESACKDVLDAEDSFTV